MTQLPFAYSTRFYTGTFKKLIFHALQVSFKHLHYTILLLFFSHNAHTFRRFIHSFYIFFPSTINGLFAKPCYFFFYYTVYIKHAQQWQTFFLHILSYYIIISLILFYYIILYYYHFGFFAT